MGIILRSAIVLALVAGASGCAPKDPKPGEPRTSVSLPSGQESSTARTDSGDTMRDATRCDASGLSSGRLGSMPLMNRIA